MPRYPETHPPTRRTLNIAHNHNVVPTYNCMAKKKKLSEQFRDGMITAKIHGRRGVCEEDKGPI